MKNKSFEIDSEYILKFIIAVVVSTLIVWLVNVMHTSKLDLAADFDCILMVDKKLDPDDVVVMIPDTLTETGEEIHLKIDDTTKCILMGYLTNVDRFIYSVNELTDNRKMGYYVRLEMPDIENGDTIIKTIVLEFPDKFTGKNS